MSRGRGGKFGTKSFNKEQLASLGAAGNDVPTPVTQPPALYPLLDRKPVPITPSIETDYLLILRQDFIDHMQLSGAYLTLPQHVAHHPEHEIDKLVAQISSNKEKFDWSLYPVELRPKVSARRVNRKIGKEVDVAQKLSQLEELEEKKGKVEEEGKGAENEEDPEEVEAMDEDEEMDDGTDYANNYFDNGEAYEDEDDNLEDGPIF